MQRKTVLMSLFVATVLVLAIIGMFFIIKPAFHGQVINSPASVADIKMADDDGNPFALSAMRGKVVLLFFGYTRCPDQCPLTLANMKRALEMIGAEAAQKVQVVMVSTDPAYDTPEVLNGYLGKFNPTFRGITGSPDDLATVYKNYNVVVLDGGETHSTFTYVIDQTGQLRLTFLPDTSPDDIAHDLNILLTER